jgi:hypothetical protein
MTFSDPWSVIPLSVPPNSVSPNRDRRPAAGGGLALLRTSDAGDEIASLLLDEWAAMNKSLHHFDKGAT